MSEITPLLDRYNGLVDVIMYTDYSVDEYNNTQRQIAQTLQQMRGKLSNEHVDSVVRISRVLSEDTIMIPMAETLGTISSDESFDFLLNRFLKCFEDGRRENATADACYQAMLRMDADRVRSEGIDRHPYFL